MKSKKILTILLSLAIMFTFMPAMAFATVDTEGQYDDPRAASNPQKYTATWADDFSSVKIGDRTFETKREMVDATYGEPDAVSGERHISSWGGLMKASIVIDEEDDDYWKYGNLDAVEYYDISNAVGAIGTNALPSGKTISQTKFKASFVQDDDEDGYFSWKSGATLRFKVPSYVKGYSLLDQTTKDATFAAPAFDRVVTLSDVSNYEDGKVADQEFDVAVTLAAPYGEEYYETTTGAYGKVPNSKFVVGKYTTEPETAAFFLDSADNAGSWSYTSSNAAYTVVGGFYDGAAHTVVAETVPGWEVSYEVYNTSTSKFEAATTVTISNVLVNSNNNADPMIVKATFKKAGMTPVERELRVNLVPADVEFGFDPDQSVVDPVYVAGDSYTETEYYYDTDNNVDHTVTVTYTDYDEVKNITYKTAESTFDAMSYVVVKPNAKRVTNWSDSKGEDIAKARAKARNAANASAVAANNAELESFKTELFSVKQTASKADPNKIALALEYKDLNSAEVKTALKKYAQLVANFNLLDEDENAEWTATMLINQTVANTKDDDITFSGVTKKTYKAKKSTKKLAKKKTFTVKAVADSGNKITFSATSTNSKITINKNTGKITVKKGLKKGTYKITVKAKTAAGNGYKAAKASKTYTIKIK